MKVWGIMIFAAFLHEKTELIWTPSVIRPMHHIREYFGYTVLAQLKHPRHDGKSTAHHLRMTLVIKNCHFNCWCVSFDAEWHLLAQLQSHVSQADHWASLQETYCVVTTACNYESWKLSTKCRLQKKVAFHHMNCFHIFIFNLLFIYHLFVNLLLVILF